jgi:MFS family permease
MDIGSAFTFMFDDEEWMKKLAIGGVIALVGTILSPILVGIVLFLPLGGYMLETLKNVRDGQTKLPEWDDFGNLFMKGLMIFLIVLIYNIPVYILACLSGGMNFAMAQPDLDEGVIQALTVLAGCFSCVQFLLSLLIGIIVPAAFIRYAQYNTFGSAFQFGEIFAFAAGNFGSYIVAVLLSWVASLLAVFGIILCVVGVFFTFFWSMLVSANLYGQVAKQATI